MRASSRAIVGTLVGAVALGVVNAGGVAAQTTPVKQQAKAPPLKWGAAPAFLPRGAKMAVVSGDPSKPGPFEIQLSFPNGYRIPPHFHPTDETVAVKSGTFLYGMGDKFDKAQLKSMTHGQSGSVPANTHHYAAARGRTVVSISSTGPFATTYVNPADDPRNTTAKKK